jgi:hypothetical protein
MGVDPQLQAIGKFLHLVEGALNGLNDSGYLDTRVGAKKMDLFDSAFGWDGLNRLENKVRYQCAVFAAAKPDHPRTWVFQIQTAEIFGDGFEHGQETFVANLPPI